MSHSLQHIVFAAVVIATAAAMILAGPGSVPALAAVFVGLIALYAAGLARRARDRDRSSSSSGSHPAGASGSGRTSSSRDSSGRAGAGRSRGEPAGGGRARSAAGGSRSSARERPGGDLTAREPRRSKASDAPKKGRTRRAEELQWLSEQLEADAEDVSFLPPYASDTVEEGAEDGGEERMESWAPPEILEAAEPRPGEEAAEAVEIYREVPVPRHFALGTVAIIRNAMQPGEVAQVLVEQRRQPKRQFGDLAVEMGLLDHGKLKDLLEAQQAGLFTDEEIREARQRLREFRQIAAST